MKIGFCMLLWTTHVTEKHRPILEALKATGYDGVEIPVFEGSADHYAGIGKMLDTFHPSPVFTSTWFIRKRVDCAACPAGEIMKVIGT